MTQPPFDLDARVRTIQIAAGALILGALAFGGIATVNGIIQAPPPAQNPADGTIALILAFISMPQLLAIPVVVASSGKNYAETKDPKQLADRYQSAVMIRGAMLEGCAFMNLSAYIIDRQWWSVAIAGGCVCLMAVMFPTRDKLREYIESNTAF